MKVFQVTFSNVFPTDLPSHRSCLLHLNSSCWNLILNKHTDIPCILQPLYWSIMHFDFSLKVSSDWLFHQLWRFPCLSYRRPYKTEKKFHMASRVLEYTMYNSTTSQKNQTLATQCINLYKKKTYFHSFTNFRNAGLKQLYNVLRQI